MSGTIEERWDREFEVKGQTFTATFTRRAFREGLEVTCHFDGTTIRVAEFGYGEFTLLELLRDKVSEALASTVADSLLDTPKKKEP